MLSTILLVPGSNAIGNITNVPEGVQRARETITMASVTYVCITHTSNERPTETVLSAGMCVKVCKDRIFYDCVPVDTSVDTPNPELRKSSRGAKIATPKLNVFCAISRRSFHFRRINCNWFCIS
ncbi:hypothetical protein TNCV_1089281 [Trichonephila clavipes]|uniref:Uncharacterized protein n=1 Tax=Trichonephila clavipes TaxID=2585209 RepID=A0A8X6VFY0_TRICX|nr:hypothetical protein TNCV_1089281 [Trichonephila clavipes]